MKINSDITSKLISIQKEKEADNYMFENNRFLLFSFALLTKTSTVLKKLFEDLDYTIEEISLYVSILKENELFNLEDEKNLKRISKKEKRNLTEEMEAIIEHLNKQVSRKLTLNSSREKRLRTLLEEGYSVVAIRSDYETIDLGNFNVNEQGKGKITFTKDALMNAKICPWDDDVENQIAVDWTKYSKIEFDIDFELNGQYKTKFM